MFKTAEQVDTGHMCIIQWGVRSHVHSWAWLIAVFKRNRFQLNSWG